MVCESPGPALMPVRLIVCGGAFSSSVIGLAIWFSVGGWLTGVTVTVKACEKLLTLAPPVGPLSVTVTVIVAVPLALATGMKESVPVVLPPWLLKL